MRNSKLIVLAFLIGTVAVSANADAQKPAQAGPPAWVIEAWESGDAPVVPANGPPAWVVEAWQNGVQSTRPDGPPPWIAARHSLALEIGLPGPPPEVIQAWENGEGFDLPGPPNFVLDLLGF